MAKEKIVYVCAQCGYESPKWQGRCPACGEWNTFKEMTVRSAKSSPAWGTGGGAEAQPILLASVNAEEEPRIDMLDAELNRVLGGGLVPGSLVLIGGEPGIGKSTILLQLCGQMQGEKILYVTGEESLKQLKMRAERLHVKRDKLYVLAETALEMAGVDRELWQYFSALKPYRQAMLAMERAKQMQRGQLSKEAVRSIYGNSIRMSASRMDQIKKCHFGYFMQYGLRAKERKSAGFDAPEIGTFIHFLLEKVLSDVSDKGGCGQVEKDELGKRVPLSAKVVTPDAARIDALLKEVFAERYLGGRQPTAEGLRRFAEACPSVLKPEPLPTYLSPAVRS